jgi:hypothetical protein
MNLEESGNNSCRLVCGEPNALQLKDETERKSEALKRQWTKNFRAERAGNDAINLKIGGEKRCSHDT